MATGRYVTDLDKGDVLGPIEYTLSKFVVREYCHANELHHDFFQNETSIAPPTLVHLDKLRLYKRACPAGTGPTARVHYEYDATIHAPVPVGVPLRVKGTVTDRYEKRGPAVRADADRPCDGAGRQALDHVSRHGDPRVQGRGISMSARFAVGTQFRLAPRLMTRERMRWYVDIQETVQQDTGRIVPQPPTIHDDDAYAKKQGLPGIISDGMVSTNWILGLLVDVFGARCGEQGAACGPNTSRRSTRIGVVITCAKVTSAVANEQGETVYGVEVWCEDDAGKKLTVGDAVVHARPR